MKKILVIVFICLTAKFVLAQPPAYYNTALGKNGVSLQNELKSIIDNHTSQSFPLWTAFYTTDKRGSNELWDMYSDIPGGTPSYTYTLGSDQCGQYNSEGDCYNHEHVWPKTYYNDASPMNSDLHHIVPTDGWVNNKRANYPYGMIKLGGLSWTSTNGSMTGTTISYPGYSGKVFEPIDEYKGDFARMFFYTSTRYKGEDNGWQNWEMANGAVLTSDAITLLLQWHHDDTVSTKEIARNNAIYNIQGNRNPFIDYPIFADCIWGTTDCTPLDVEDIFLREINIFPNPAKDVLQVSLPQNLEQENIVFQVFNAVGQKVITSHSEIISLQNIPAGIYALHVLVNEKSRVITFVKNNN